MCFCILHSYTNTISNITYMYTRHGQIPMMGISWKVVSKGSACSSPTPLLPTR